MISRRSLLATVPALAAAGLVTARNPAQAADKVLHIGYQKYGTLLLLKAAGTLDKLLAPQGFTVQWSEFLAGPPLLEAMNAGAISFGITGETPPVFAQAAGTPFVYLAADPAAPQGEGIVVPPGSTVKSVAELRGKHVITTKGSNAHYCLVALLLKAGLRPSEVNISYLSPPDAFAAFRAGSVDAWCGWDPLFAAAELTGGRLLADGTGVVPNHQFFLANRSFAEANPAVIHTLLDAVLAEEKKVQANPAAAAATIGPATGIPIPVLQKALPRMGYGLAPMTPEIFADQQKIADTFFSLGLVPKKITVTDNAWKG
ncbi:aliphatic sulfonate ABC transporter substrate-binding protein [Acidisoma silvae]|uniref:Putative aliphatic sulfonates-binding protein n=1 Tax=Acidisoma silvae TaxID=2802396 RepID=A0A964DZD8_9PROT|nr:aliphatic sulfonate ABC transporter substrate-binding protein [Acidisoma silvae]MCB8876017.1 aliphatic sulfonate ABC transporter substrate-binding protein [Acidisoma silvae]